MTIDPSIRIGDILTLIFFLIGGLGFAWSMRGDLKMLARDMQLQSKKIEKLETIITTQAVQTQRMDDLSRRRKHVIGVWYRLLLCNHLHGRICLRRRYRLKRRSIDWLKSSMPGSSASINMLDRQCLCLAVDQQA